MIVAFSPFGFRWPSEASRWLQEGPREPQERPKRAQDRPRQPQERSTESPGHPIQSQDRPKRGSRDLRIPQVSLKDPKTAPREAVTVYFHAYNLFRFKVAKNYCKIDILAQKVYADLALGLWAGPREGPLWGLGLLGRGAPGPNRAPKGPGDPGAPTKRPKPHLSQRAQGPPLNLIFFGLWELTLLGFGNSYALRLREGEPAPEEVPSLKRKAYEFPKPMSVSSQSPKNMRFRGGPWAPWALWLR